MSKSYTLEAEARERVGKGSSRALRRKDFIPAVIYGEKKDALSIAVKYKEIFYKIHAGAFLTTIATIHLGKEKIKVLPKSYQLDPIKDYPIHVDFLRISDKSEVIVHIPIHFSNEENSPGLKYGGVLNIVRHELECVVSATNIPDSIDIDLSGYEVGDSIHLSSVKLPEGVKSHVNESDATIATIAAPAGLASGDENETTETES